MDDQEPQPKFGPIAMMERIDKAMADIGCETFVVMAVDPDSDHYACTRKGSILWAIGAMNYYSAVCIKRHMDEPE